MGFFNSIIEAFKPLDNKDIQREEEIPKVKESWKYSKLFELHEKWSNKRANSFGEVLELWSDIESDIAEGGD